MLVGRVEEEIIQDVLDTHPIFHSTNDTKRVKRDKKEKDRHTDR